MLLKRSHPLRICKAQILTLQAWGGSCEPSFLTVSQVVPSCPARTTHEQQDADTPSAPAPPHRLLLILALPS